MEAHDSVEKLAGIEAMISQGDEKEAALFAAGWLEANIVNRFDVMPIKTREHLRLAIKVLKAHGGTA
jgi:hypothetical protein